MSKVVLLSVENETVNVMNLLAKADTPRLDDLVSDKKLASVLLRTNSDFVFYQYSRSRKRMEIVEKLISMQRSGTCSGVPITAFPLVIVEGFPVELMGKYVFSIFLEGSLEGVSIERQWIVPPDCQLQVVADKIRTVTKEADCWDEKVFMAAACFLYPNLVSNGKEKVFDELLACAKRLVNLNNNSLSLTGMEEVLIQELYQWQERTAFCELYELPNIDMNIMDRRENCIFYDDEFLFMKESLFKTIFGSLLQVFPTNGVKAALVNSGILCPENTFTYTAKMAFYNVAGQYQRERMLRFRRSKLSILGEMDFVELCLLAKEIRKND